MTGKPAVVDTEKTEVSQVVSQAAVENLPIAGRRWESFVLLTPNVTTDGGTGLVSYRGISGLYNSNSVDGANNNQAFFSEAQRPHHGVPYVYSMDSIQEFQVSSSNYSAEFGQAAGGVVNAVTKSGTNGMHGDLFYYLRYPSLNALDPIQKSRRQSTPSRSTSSSSSAAAWAVPSSRTSCSTSSPTTDRARSTPSATPAASHVPAALSRADDAAPRAPPPTTSVVGCWARFRASPNQDVAFGKIDYQLNSKNHVSASFDLRQFPRAQLLRHGITSQQ